MNPSNSLETLAVLWGTCFLYNGIWYLKFRDSLADTDFAYVSYYGRKAAKAGDRRVFAEARDFPAFKTILYYLFYWASHISKSPTRAPRFLFAASNTAGCLLFSTALLSLTGSPQKTWIGTLIYCILSSAPPLGALYLQAEFWALTFTCGSIALILSGHPAALFLAGLLMSINPLTVKPLYLLESAALLSLAPSDRLPLILSGFVLGSAFILSVYRKDGFFDWFAYHMKGWKVLNYPLKFSRDPSRKGQRRNLTVFMPVFGWTILPLLLPAVLSRSTLPSGLWFLLSAGSLIVLIQYRFYRYHFVCLLPATLLLYACAPFSFLHLAGLVPVMYTFSFFFFWDIETLDRRINRRIRHYHTRNCVSRPISKWIRENSAEHDRILVVGSTIQIYVHSDRFSIYPQLFFTPEVLASNPGQEDVMKRALAETPPEIIVPDQNCLNWAMVEHLTKHRYRLVQSFVSHSELFPVYRRAEKLFPGDPPLNQSLFIECLRTNEQGRTWNPIPGEGRTDPNPTVQEQPA